MNDQVDSNENDETAVDELALLRDRAQKMGIKISGNIGLETLRKKINDRLAGEPDAPEEGNEEEAEVAAAPTPPAAPVAPAPAAPIQAAPARKLTKEEKEQELRQSIQKEKMALVRCRIHNLNPAKRDLHGEIITVGNRYLGTVRKFIPFGEQTDNGYHIPKCIYDDLRSRKYQHIQTKTVKGQIEVKTRMAPEYNIEILPPLTKEELAELALSQQAAERVGV